MVKEAKKGCIPFFKKIYWMIIKAKKASLIIILMFSIIIGCSKYATKIDQSEIITGFSLNQVNTSIKEAINKGSEFIKTQIDKDQYSLSCKSSGKSSCPVHNTGYVFSSFFIVEAIGNELLLRKDKLISKILSEERDGLWGYSNIAPVDSDDTAFVIQTLNNLDKSIPLENLLSFYDKESKWFTTFLTNNPARLAFDPSESNNDNIHPEVNANIYRVLLNSSFQDYIDYDLILQSQTEQGYWNSYFYPGKYYSTYINLDFLCRADKLDESKEKGINFIINSQNDDGSWGKPGNSYETALALNSLAVCEVINEQFGKGILFLLKNQLKDGSWKNSEVIWEYYSQQDPLVIWRAYDDNKIVVSSLCIKALKKANLS